MDHIKRVGNKKKALDKPSQAKQILKILLPYMYHRYNMVNDHNYPILFHNIHQWILVDIDTWMIHQYWCKDHHFYMVDYLYNNLDLTKKKQTNKQRQIIR